MIVGADFVEVDLNIDSQNSTVAKAVYNAVPLHSLPLSINMLNNALLKVEFLEVCDCFIKNIFDI